MSSNFSLYENFILDGSKCKYPPGLYLVGTPIGNLEDITLRALYTLQKVDLIACEDTRVTKRLLSHFGIKNRLVTYNDAKGDAGGEIKQALLEGKRVALVSDAGMPLISDPGFKLVEFVHDNDLYVTCIPGPSSTLTALTLSGLPSHEFTIKGFFPKKEKETTNTLDSLCSEHTFIFFESPNRLETTMKRISRHESIETAVVARELTKSFEEVISGSPDDILNRMPVITLKGEIVLLLHTKPQIEHKEDLSQDIKLLLESESVKTIVDIYRDKTSLSKKELYDYVLALKKDLSDA